MVRKGVKKVGKIGDVGKYLGVVVQVTGILFFDDGTMKILVFCGSLGSLHQLFLRVFLGPYFWVPFLSDVWRF